ncbi:hypothetical protein [Actinomycetospora aeridis]|uniref:Transcriptional regulator n=1 Tax=Actinomycetospora aeridis TaxID=3129231 RepID=A0ABU8MYL9_9PSEU
MHWPELRFADDLWAVADPRPGAGAVRHTVREVTRRSRPEDPDDVISGIESARLCAEHLEEILILLVAEARARGVAWSAIGDVLGVGRTAAQKRFGPTLDAARATVRAQHRGQLEMARLVMENIHLETEQRVDMYERFLERSGYLTASQLYEARDAGADPDEDDVAIEAGPRPAQSDRPDPRG